MPRGKQSRARRRAPSPRGEGRTAAPAPVGEVHATRAGGVNRRALAGVVSVAVVLAVAAALFVMYSKAQAPVTSVRSTSPRTTGTRSAGNGGTSTPVASSAPVIDGIPCNSENITYHVHAHLEVWNRGRQIVVPANTGIVDNTCLYWLHTHDSSGEIHIEEPKQTRLTLGDFFDIWHQPLTPTAVASAPVGKDRVRVYVDRKLYSGNPRAILLTAHKLIAVEIGPPFVPPSTFNFQGD